MNPPKKDKDCCQVFQALSDPTRLKILMLLQKKKEACVSEICSHFNMTQPSISHHLDILKRNRLVTSEKRGREVYYQYSGAVVIVQCCDSALKELDVDVRKKN